MNNKNIIVTEKDFCLASASELNQICQPFLKKLNLALFVYGRFYNDGGCSVLSTNPHILQHNLKQGYLLTIPIPEQFIKTKFHYLLVPTDGYDKVLYECATYFNIDSGIDFIEREKDYYEMFYFSLPANTPNSQNFYLHHLDEFEKFKLYFKSKGGSLLTKSYQNKILLPEDMRSNIKGFNKDLSKGSTFQYPINNEEFSFTIHGEQVKLTAREFQCFILILKGLSAKEISNLLYISSRTVEIHFKNIKKKLRCHNKSDFIQLGIRLGILKFLF